MNQHCTFTALAVLSTLLSVTANAATPPKPKIVFLGDQITLNWTGAFAANPNWINKGVTVGVYPQTGTLDAGLARFQSDVVSQHPAVVHIMFGTDDLETTSPASLEYFESDVLSDVQAIVQQAKAANIQVVFGLEATEFAQTSAIISAYAAQNNIPVINYGAALSGAIYPAFSIEQYNAVNPTPLLMPDPNNVEGQVPTVAGYAVMTQMAEATLYTLGQTLTGGYLQNYSQPYQGSAFQNVNVLGPYHNAQFIPYGTYTGGLVEPVTNTPYAFISQGNFQATGTGANGVWASSNPLVMAINQQGYALALTAGTAIITFTPPNLPAGVRFHEWIMTVTAN